MKYEEFLKRNRFDFEEVLAFAYGRLVDDPPEHFDAKLPAPPFLMVDRILLIESNGKQGKIIAELDIKLMPGIFSVIFRETRCSPDVSGWMRYGSCSVFSASGKGLWERAARWAAEMWPLTGRSALLTNACVSRLTSGVTPC